MILDDGDGWPWWGWVGVFFWSMVLGALLEKEEGVGEDFCLFVKKRTYSLEIPTPVAFQTDDLDAFDSDCDEAPSASAVFMAKLSSCDLEILSEVPIHDNYLDNHVFDQNVQEMQYSEQPVFNNDIDIDITSDSNMISYEQYLKEIENMVVQNTSSSA
ncbi:hypothetical protein Tco_0506266 [Tanacetum coccineum]